MPNNSTLDKVLEEYRVDNIDLRCKLVKVKEEMRRLQFEKSPKCNCRGSQTKQHETSVINKELATKLLRTVFEKCNLRPKRMST